MTETHSEKHTLQFEPEAAPEEGDEDMEVPKPPSLLVFSGGTAFNSVAGTGQLSTETSCLCNSSGVYRTKHKTSVTLITASSNAGTLRSFTTRVAHVLPVSDDGGSTAEIVRVLGGPAVGDIRSRCLRLADDSNTEVSTEDWSMCIHIE